MPGQTAKTSGSTGTSLASYFTGPYNGESNGQSGSIYGLDSGAAGAIQNSGDSKSTAAGQTASLLGNIKGGFGLGVGAGYQVVSQLGQPYLAYRQSQFQKRIFGMQQNLANMEATLYQTAAEDVLRQGQQQVAATTYQLGQNKAKTRVSQAAAGVKIAGAGSAAEVLASQSIVAEIQCNQILANAITQSYTYQRQKVSAKIKAISFEAAKDSISPWANAITTAIGSLTSMTESGSISSLLGSFFGGSTENAGSGLKMPSNWKASDDGGWGFEGGTDFGLSSGGATLGSGSSFGLSGSSSWF